MAQMILLASSEPFPPHSYVSSSLSPSHVVSDLVTWLRCPAQGLCWTVGFCWACVGLRCPSMGLHCPALGFVAPHSIISYIY
jgi:hypothetical protein